MPTKSSPVRIELDQVLVAHTCNSSYSGNRAQEDHRSKPAWENSSSDPILKNNQNRDGRVAQVVKCLLSKLEALGSNPSTVAGVGKRIDLGVFGIQNSVGSYSQGIFRHRNNLNCKTNKHTKKKHTFSRLLL
jgi:hypothetical protein